MRSAACAARSCGLRPAKDDRKTVMAWFQTTRVASFGAATLDASADGFVDSAAMALEAKPQRTRAPTTNHNRRNPAGCLQRHKPAQKRLEIAVSLLASSPLTGEERGEGPMVVTVCTI